MSNDQASSTPPPLPPPRPVLAIDYATAAPGHDQVKRPLLAKWALIPVLLFVVAEPYILWDSARSIAVSSPAGAVIFMFTRVLGCILFSTLLGWLFYRTLRRSTVAGTVAFTAMLLTIGVVTARFIYSRPSRAALTASLVVSDLNHKLAMAEIAMISADFSRMFDREHIWDEGECERRLEIVQRAIDSSQTYIDASDNLWKDLAQKLTADGVRSSEIPIWQTKLQRQNAWALRRPEYLARQQILKETAAMLTLLAKNRDGWGVDNSNKKLIFYRKSLMNEFNVLKSRCSQAAATQESENKRLMGEK